MIIHHGGYFVKPFFVNLYPLLKIYFQFIILCNYSLFVAIVLVLKLTHLIKECL